MHGDETPKDDEMEFTVLSWQKDGFLYQLTASYLRGMLDENELIAIAVSVG